MIPSDEEAERAPQDAKGENAGESSSPEAEEHASVDTESDAGSGSGDADRCPVVGIGSSAGGLEALKGFFGKLRADIGLSYIVVSHQHRGHTSMLPELIGNVTEMSVSEAEDGVIPEPDHVYFSPPGIPISLENGVIREHHPDDANAGPLIIDLFFRSLAQDRGQHAICIVLSGTGTDGTLGLKAVKGAGGIAMVQEAASARYPGMPRSAIATSQADFVLSVEEIAEKLTDYTKTLRMRDHKESAAVDEADDDSMREIFRLLKSHTGHDFSDYKVSTLQRRIVRGLNVHQIEKLRDYVRFLRANPHEIDTLFKEFLIGVTSFFRDPKAFEILAERALPDLIQRAEQGAAFRTWVVGCGSGEEAYTVAIILREAAQKQDKDLEFTVFSTDLDGDSIESARAGRFPEGIANDVPADKLERYFEKADSTYRIRREIRDMVVFAPQNVISDPPFTKLDLVCCRNVLIYMNSDLQKRVLPVFHYALKPGGLLMLGPSESVGHFRDLFEPVDKTYKIYRRLENESYDGPPILMSGGERAVHDTDKSRLNSGNSHQERHLTKVAEALLLERFTPPSVIVNQHGEVKYIHGRTGTYLEPAKGEPPGRILDMAREGLQVRLAAALREASGSKGEAVRRGVRVKTNGNWTYVDVSITRISEPKLLAGLFLVSFRPAPKRKELERVTSAAADGEHEHSGERGDAEGTRVLDLERELRYTKESLQTTVEELETSNEELKSTNEELQSTNEELQSANEELETSKEETQSLNEELTTVNNELQAKVDELADANNDMQNLLNSTDIATVFLDERLNIKRFTRKAKEVISLIDSDLGRPIGDLADNFQDGKVTEEANQVLDTLNQVERQVRTKDGRWYLMRMSPYRTPANVIEGVVITFIEIDHLRGQMEETANEWAFYESIFDALREPVLILNPELEVVAANNRFYTTFKLGPKQCEGKKVFEIGKRQWDQKDLHHLLEEVLPHNHLFYDYRLEGDFGPAGKRTMLLNARRLCTCVGQRDMILLAMEDAENTS